MNNPKQNKVVSLAQQKSPYEPVPKLYQDTPIIHARSTLLQWYDQHKRNLPWRDIRDPWATWVSEIMLQQTKVVSVLEYFDRFMTRFPTPHDLAKAEWEEIASLWAGLGYYSRARNLWKGAQQVVEKHDGIIPSTAEEISAISGIGPYTTGAILSIAFNQPAPLVDGNVQRVFSRLFMIEDVIKSKSAQKLYWQLAKEWVVGERPGDLNQALMELGATVCTPKAPACLLCPLQNECRVKHLADPLAYPKKIKKVKKRPREEWLALILERSSGVDHQASEYALVQRASEGLLAGFWSLVMTQRTSSEIPSIQEWTEWLSELAMPVAMPSMNIDQVQTEQLLNKSQFTHELLKIKHAFTHKEWLLWVMVYDVDKFGELSKLNDHVLEWYTVEELDHLAIGGPTLKALLAHSVPLKRRRGSGRKSLKS